MRNAWRNNRGYTRTELIVGGVAVIVLLTMLAPAVMGAITRAEAARCAAARHSIEKRYDEYSGYRQSGETFLEYARTNVDKFDGNCPAGGRLVVLVSDPDSNLASAHVYCTKHSEDYARIEVPEFTSPDTALEFAGQVYALGTLYMAGLQNSFDAIANGDCLPFDRLYNETLGRAIESEREFSVSLDGKVSRVAASEEFRSFLDYGANTLPVGKIFFKMNDAGAYTNEIDYVVVKQGGCWAKYSPEGSESGTGAEKETVRPARKAG